MQGEPVNPCRLSSPITRIQFFLHFHSSLELFYTKLKWPGFFLLIYLENRSLNPSLIHGWCFLGLSDVFSLVQGISQKLSRADTLLYLQR